MAITDNDIAGFVALAGERFEWEGVRGSSRPAADVRKGLRLDLWTRQGETCPVCGMGETGEPIEFNHVVARGPKVKGFIPGNVFAGHASCNARTKPIYDEAGTLLHGIEILWTLHLHRPDVIPTDWTPFPVLRANK